MTNVKAHYRRTKKGKKTVVGRHKRSTKSKKKILRRKASLNDIPVSVKRQVLQDYSQEIQKDLRGAKRAKLLDLGVITVKTKPATKGGKKVQAFGKTFITKPKPKKAIIKFRAGKALMEKLA